MSCLSQAVHNWRVCLQHLTEAQPQVDALRVLGVSLAMDGFGSSVSSLTLLRTMPLHAIKLSAGLLGDAMSDPRQRRVLQALVEMARSLQIETIALGVETRPQAAFLASLGQSLVQGYAYFPPMAEHEITALLEGAGA